MKAVVLLLALLMIVFAFVELKCNVTKRTPVREESTGRLYYFRKFNERARMRVEDGEFTVLDLDFNHHSKPKGVMDGDGGNGLHITFLSDTLVRPGARYEIPAQNIDVCISAWGSPAYFAVKRNITGFVFIEEYEPFKKLVLTFDLSTSTKAEQIARNKLKFDCIQADKLYNGPAVMTHDDSVLSPAITPEELSGKWQLKSKLRYENTVRTGWYESLLEERRLWEIGDGKLAVEGRSEIISIKGRTLTAPNVITGMNPLYIDRVIGNTLTVVDTSTRYAYIFEKVQE